MATSQAGKKPAPPKTTKKPAAPKKAAGKVTSGVIGRPSSYKPEYAEWAEKLAKLGATDKDMADAFEVCEATINSWKHSHPDFLESIKKGKAIADAEVAHKLFHRATGYEHPEVDVKVVNGEIILTQLVKHYAPDTTAAIFWLKNRRPDLWRDKIESQLTGPNGGPLQARIAIEHVKAPPVQEDDDDA